jgi:galactose-1-phosphate uridylyltransferase
MLTIAKLLRLKSEYYTAGGMLGSGIRTRSMTVGRFSAMPIEYEMRDGALLWIKNPITGVISYVVDVRGKSFAFTLGGREELNPEAPVPDPKELHNAMRTCPFCPGNENLAPPEVMRVRPAEFPSWRGREVCQEVDWVIRVFNNRFPRIPESLTGGRNESYIVVEDPRHFSEHPRSINDLMYTAALGEEHFHQLLLTDVRLMRRVLENPAVHSVVIRKNQGRESGASQPHPHQQVIGAPQLWPAVEAERRAERENPRLWQQLIEIVERAGLMIEQRDGVISYASPIGAFPRSYDVVMPEFRGSLIELDNEDLRRFSRAIFRLVHILGPLPLDYEIHQGPGVPLHAHVNGRLYPYSNVAGTLNLPSQLVRNVAALRKALARN